MPHAVMSSEGLPSVTAYACVVDQALAQARKVKPDGAIEPALTTAHFQDELEALVQARKELNDPEKQTTYASIETAVRNRFYTCLSTASIYQPEFCDIWNLLDIVLIIADNELCEPGLVCWLVEELLDSQTIDGCRRVFDYLDSRRERMIAKHFKSKQLIILRACNELLRRLSRAEDTVFCGRVFIYLFQSFPLGDKSAVNLRGEFHTDNVTTYDTIAPQSEADPAAMDVDIVEKSVTAENGEKTTITVTEPAKPGATPTTPSDAKTAGKTEAKPEEKRKVLDVDTLYPIFWSLQEYFSKPTKLFDPENLKQFKEGLTATLDKFKEVQSSQDARGGGTKALDEPRGTKRKWEDDNNSGSSAFNPKYLTSRDLFELEISDLAFRRHVLVQALILSEFLLSQTEKAKSKLVQMKNKSVLYDFTLDETEAQWATQMKLDIATYLQQGNEGKFYYRMVDTVLSRDKNWVYWKAEGCPQFQLPSITGTEYVEAQGNAQRATTNKKIRLSTMGGLNLGFLTELDGADAMSSLQKPDRYTIPTAESFRMPIADDEFDLSGAKTEEEKSLSTNARASKLWRTFRIASKRQFGLFDKIDDGNNLDALFKSQVEETTEGSQIADGETMESEATSVAPLKTSDTSEAITPTMVVEPAAEPTILESTAVK